MDNLNIIKLDFFNKENQGNQVWNYIKNQGLEAGLQVENLEIRDRKQESKF